jgi:hypothetical protein
MDAKASERELDRALERSDPIAEPQRAVVGRGEIGRRIRPERVAPVVEQHAVAQVALVPGACGVAGRSQLRGLPQTLAGREHDLAEASELFRAARDERLVDPD